MQHNVIKYGCIMNCPTLFHDQQNRDKKQYTSPNYLYYPADIVILILFHYYRCKLSFEDVF